MSTVEESVSNIDKSILINVSVVGDQSVSNVRKQIKSEVEQLIKIQQCVSKQVSEETVPMIKTEKHLENKVSEKVPSPAVGPVHIKAPTFD